MDKVYSEDEVRKLIKMSHILASESDFKEVEFSETIKRDRYLYRVGEDIADIVINYDKYYLRWSLEYLVWFKTTFNSFPHDTFHSINNIDEILSLQKEFKSINVVTFDEYKVLQLKLQRISKEIEKQIN